MGGSKVKKYFLKLHQQILFTKIDEEPISSEYSTNVYIPLNSLENYEATSADSVQIYVAQLPSRGFKEIGIFYFPSKGRINRPEQMAKNITVAKEFAAQHGANAVIRLDVTDFNVKGVAVRWK